MSIERLLSRPVEALPPDASCGDAARRMRACNVGAIVVADEGRPLGILTDRDIALRVVAERLDPERTPVSDAMSSCPVFLSSERSLDQLISTMRDLAIRRIPVVDSTGQLEGVLALDDLILLLADQLQGIASAIRKEIAPPAPLARSASGEATT